MAGDLKMENDRLRRDLSENSEVFEDRDRMKAELNAQEQVLNNFRFTILAEIGHDLADTSFEDDDKLSTVERVQAAITAYFNHQEKLKMELEVEYTVSSQYIYSKLSLSETN